MSTIGNVLRAIPEFLGVSHERSGGFCESPKHILPVKNAAVSGKLANYGGEVMKARAKIALVESVLAFLRSYGFSMATIAAAVAVAESLESSDKDSSLSPLALNLTALIVSFPYWFRQTWSGSVFFQAPVDPAKWKQLKMLAGHLEWLKETIAPHYQSKENKENKEKITVNSDGIRNLKTLIGTCCTDGGIHTTFFKEILEIYLKIGMSADQFNSLRKRIKEVDPEKNNPIAKELRNLLDSYENPEGVALDSFALDTVSGQERAFSAFLNSLRKTPQKVFEGVTADEQRKFEKDLRETVLRRAFERFSSSLRKTPQKVLEGVTLAELEKLEKAFHDRAFERFSSSLRKTPQKVLEGVTLPELEKLEKAFHEKPKDYSGVLKEQSQVLQKAMNKYYDKCTSPKDFSAVLGTQSAAFQKAVNKHRKEFSEKFKKVEQNLFRDRGIVAAASFAFGWLANYTVGPVSSIFGLVCSSELIKRLLGRSDPRAMESAFTFAQGQKRLPEQIAATIAFINASLHGESDYNKCVKAIGDSVFSTEEKKEGKEQKVQ